MTTDLVARLREQSSKWFDDDSAGIAVMTQAADEIERLRETLQMVADADDDCHRDGFQTIPPAARARINRALGKAAHPDVGTGTPP